MLSKKKMSVDKDISSVSGSLVRFFFFFTLTALSNHDAEEMQWCNRHKEVSSVIYSVMPF